MVFDRALLTKIAHHPAPETFPPNVYVAHTAHTVTIFDAFPKADYHFLVIPRLPFPSQTSSSTTRSRHGYGNLRENGGRVGSGSKSNGGYFKLKGTLTNARTEMESNSDLDFMSLQSFFQAPGLTRERAKAFFRKMKEDAEALRTEIEIDMRLRRGFVSELYIGFHMVASMDHIHMHIISSDLCSPHLKTKKHYNSFHPSLGFFLHLDDIISRLGANDDDDEDDADLKEIAKRFANSELEAKLKDPLRCFHCLAELKNMPRLKEHLQDHFDKNAKDPDTPMTDCGSESYASLL